EEGVRALPLRIVVEAHLRVQLGVHRAMVARTGRTCRQTSGQISACQPARSTGRSRGLSVRPGIRPRFAIGRPSISLMSPVKSIGAAPLMYEPTAYESTGAPASLKYPI